MPEGDIDNKVAQLENRIIRLERNLEITMALAIIATFVGTLAAFYGTAAGFIIVIVACLGIALFLSMVVIRGARQGRSAKANTPE